RLAERPRVERAFGAAREAEAKYRRLREQAEARKRLSERIAQIDERLTHERGHLKGELNTIRTQLSEAASSAVPIEALREEEERLAAAVAEVEGWQRDQEAVREEGMGVKEQLAAGEAERVRLREEIAALEAKRARVRTTEDEACPTCGTPLTEDHRRHVEATYDRELAALRATLDEHEARFRALEAARDDLRRRLLDLRARVEQTNGVAVKLVQVREKLARHDEDQAERERRRARAEHLERLLEAEAFLPELRAERTDCQDRLDAEPFDEAELEAAQAEIARLPLLREQMEELDRLAAGRDALAHQARQHEAEIARLRADLDAGPTLAPLQRQIESLTAQLERIGYDGQRHDAVLRELDGLAEAPHDFTRLMEAQRNLADWVRRRADHEAEQAALAEEEGRLRQALTQA